MARPVTVPRGPITPFGKALKEQGIPPRAMGEAIALAEHKPEPVRTVQVNEWIWGKTRPSGPRQRLIAEFLDRPVAELFPSTPRVRSQAELDLLAKAAKSRAPRRPITPAAGAAHIERARAQKTLANSSTTGRDDIPCIIERKKRRARRAASPKTAANAARKAA